MEFIISGRNTPLDDRLKETIEKKLGKLEKFFSNDVQARVTLSAQRNHQKIEVNIPVKGELIRGESEADDIYVAVDEVVDVLESQLRKYRKKIIDRYQSAATLAKEYIENDDDTDDSEIKIVKTKQFQFKPMDPEEACMQMELLGHSFFVFTNAQTNDVNVVYKRKGDTYGIIEPEF